MVEKHHIQAPVEIITLYLNIPQKYKHKCIEEIYKLGDSQDNITNLKCIMSSYWIWNESKVFNSLLGNIHKIIISQYGEDTQTLEMINAWSAIYKEGNYSVSHNHRPNSFSFVYYLKSNGTTPLIFEDCNFRINPLDDLLLIFPSYLNHHVPKHIGQEDRICIAGNLDCKSTEDNKQYKFANSQTVKNESKQ